MNFSSLDRLLTTWEGEGRETRGEGVRNGENGCKRLRESIGEGEKDQKELHNANYGNVW